MAGSRTSAVVLGGSMGGLLAARVLADHVDQVTVVDRDDLPAEPGHRTGVPQSRHAHALLPRGAEILERLLPGLVGGLVADGAFATGSPTAMRMVTPAGPLPPVPSESGFVGFSRPLLEWHVRARVAALGNVTVRPRHDVLGPVSDGAVDRAAVVGAAVRCRDTGESSVLPADLVVDATGRGSRAPRWLVELGCGPVPEETVDSGIGYATRWFDRPADWSGPWDAAVVNGRVPDVPRVGLVLPVEGNRWTITVGGLAGTFPPLDESGFLDYARTLTDPCVATAIEAGTPVTPVRTAHTPVSRLRHFERLRRWPRGFLVTGDAVCAFNPIYGQGMTVSAMDALVLDAELRSDRPDLEGRFRRALAAEVAGVWSIASGEDLRWGVGSSGVRPRRGSTLLRSYVDRVQRRAVVDPVVAGAWGEVVGLLSRPSTLLRPSIAARVLVPRPAAAPVAAHPVAEATTAA
jgi:2-polyprenyl-6-methoxyphenol hydroxylase-like FAD-dependent oxidoreductase